MLWINVLFLWPAKSAFAFLLKIIVKEIADMRDLVKKIIGENVTQIYKRQV